MDLDKAIELAPRYLSDYVSTAVATLVRPGVRFASETVDLEGPVLVTPDGEVFRRSGTRLNSAVFTFALISAAIGIVITELIPNPRAGTDFVSTLVVLLVSWFASGTLVHWISAYYHAPSSSRVSDRMRGADEQTSHMFSHIVPEERVREDHPLRAIRRMTNDVLTTLSPRFERMYSDMGRPSIPPEQLLRALLLQSLFHTDRGGCLP